MKQQSAPDVFTLLGDLYYLLQNIRGDGAEELATLARARKTAKPALIAKLERSNRKYIAKLKRKTGCLLTDPEIHAWATHMQSGEGWVYIAKWNIEKHWFTKYERVFPRWPHMPLHSMIVFDTDPNVRSPYAVWIAEGALFDEMKLSWSNAMAIADDGKTFRTRSRARQHELHAFLRLAVSSAYQFIEAYLNGIAFGCFRLHHDTLDLDDHDLLSEWNSKKQRVSFVAFESKIRKYPVVCGKYFGRTVEQIAGPDVEYLVGPGKQLRDALVHPSPYVRSDAKDMGKTTQILTISVERVTPLVRAAVRYVKEVETALGRKPADTMPWLSELA